MISVICMSQRLSSFLPRLSVNSSRNATPRHRRCNYPEQDSLCSVAYGLQSDGRLAGLPGLLLRTPARWQSPSAKLQVEKRAKVVADRFFGTENNTPGSSEVTDAFPAASCACCQRSAEQFRPESRDYFGERMSAWVLISRLCFSTTRRSSRSMVLNASWITFLSGS